MTEDEKEKIFSMFQLGAKMLIADMELFGNEWMSQELTQKFESFCVSFMEEMHLVRQCRQEPRPQQLQ